MGKAKKWVLAKYFEGFPKKSDFKLVEEDLPPLKDGEVLVEAMFLSLDPYMRMFMPFFPLGSTVMGQQVAKIVESKHPDWPVETVVLANVGWRDRTVVDTAQADQRGEPTGPPLLMKVSEDVGFMTPSVALGAIGMTGATAYFGVMEVLKPQPGETLFVNASAGAVGSVVGQIGKILGCRVIGCASTKEKCDWLKEIGFDYVYNYKERDGSEALKEGAPNGIDCLFELVGGEFCATVIRDHMNELGRVAMIGSITEYNNKEPKRADGPYPWSSITEKMLTIRGFDVYYFFDQWPKAMADLSVWVKQRKVKYLENVTDGFENMPQAFSEMLTSGKLGKAVVRV